MADPADDDAGTPADEVPAAKPVRVTWTYHLDTSTPPHWGRRAPRTDTGDNVSPTPRPEPPHDPPGRETLEGQQTEFGDSPVSGPQKHWGLDLLAGGALFVAIAGLNAIANLNDVRAFAALATPATYAWLVLSLVCWSGLVVTGAARRRGVKTPMYFRVILMVGVASALLTVSTAWRVLTKHSDHVQSTNPGDPLDFRGLQLTNKSYAQRDLRRAIMTRARLTHVDFSGANLSEADFRGAHLVDVEMNDVDLCGTDLRGADLRGTRNLYTARNWAYTFYDGATRWPDNVNIIEFPGPVKDTGRGLLYMCRANNTWRIAPERKHTPLRNVDAEP